ncbi:DUF4157 domain-containing protein [Streptomyces sp. CBMA156]|uniref:eCIS core domain-containing protein n=1 Tax=Streptomyces sp. CBMA156 TaxID=1930280 RepID=UPI001CB83A13|nr:DUF4157 domain-containing protein [Streptomyces sp. CBMA156]MBD0671942.1 hypothetical protein [Streptomyces sp. CBMA156]
MRAHDPDHQDARTPAPPVGRRTDNAPREQAPASLPSGLLALQRSAGNAAVVRMLRRTGHVPPAVQRHEHDAGCGHPTHQRTGAGPGAAVQRSAVADVLRSAGRPLDDTTRTDMENRFGADFTDVRIHDGPVARRSATEVGARAYTSGSHVVIGEGGGDTHTLAHELTHVIQQRRGPVAGTDNGSGLRVSDPSDRFEREAEANARRVMAGPSLAPEVAGTSYRASPSPAGAGTTAVQRYATVDAEIGDFSKARISESGKYVLLGMEGDNWSNVIWVREDATEIPKGCRRSNAPSLSYDGSQYLEYVPDGLFLADCAHTAEEVMHGRSLKYSETEQEAAEAPVVSKFRGITGDSGEDLLFGEGNEENIGAAKKYAGRREGTGQGPNHQESPEVGQAFVTVETSLDEEGNPGNASGWPFHVAAVVAVDGGDRITLEQTASERDAKPGDGRQGIFDMYGVGNKTTSFHARGRKGNNFSNKAITAVIAGREGIDLHLDERIRTLEAAARTDHGVADELIKEAEEEKSPEGLEGAWGAKRDAWESTERVWQERAKNWRILGTNLTGDQKKEAEQEASRCKDKAVVAQEMGELIGAALERIESGEKYSTCIKGVKSKDRGKKAREAMEESLVPQSRHDGPSDMEIDP